MATDVVDVVVEEVASNLEEVADATRRINTNSVGFFLGGVAVGAALGFYYGYRFNKAAIKAEAYRDSEVEIEKIRELYQQKTVAAQPKPSVEEVIEERGYSVAERPLKAPVPVHEPPAIIETRDPNGDIWNYPEELQNRTEDEPYVIHQDEFRGKESGYDQVTYTYWATDDVMCGEDERPLPHADYTVGQSNLKWGHGTDDIDVVFVRNDKLELEMEICRVHKSYEEEVLGLDGNAAD